MVANKMRLKTLILLSLSGFVFSKKAKALSVDELSKCHQIAKAYLACSSSKFLFNKISGDFKLATNKVVKCHDMAKILDVPYYKGMLSLPVLDSHQDPGRTRVDDFNFAIYGSNEQQVSSNTKKISFLKIPPYDGTSVSFSNLNGAARQLQKVNEDLISLTKSNRRVADFLSPYIQKTKEGIYGFNWRTIAGTNRLSNHSFGVAIDVLAHKGSQYWLWDFKKDLKDGLARLKNGASTTNINEEDIEFFNPKSNATFPLEIVDVFEKHGFIWGGKWYHYDIMHFEYRPEFFAGFQPDCRPL